MATSTIAPDPTAPPVDTGPDPAQIALGESKFGSCSGCHGSDARGVPGLGKDLVESEFIDSQTAEELVAFIKIGRSSGDPASTTGIDMPPRGGNPALSDDDLAAIVAYIHSLQ